MPQIRGAFSMEKEGGDQVSLMSKPIFLGMGGGGSKRNQDISKTSEKRICSFIVPFASTFYLN